MMNNKIMNILLWIAQVFVAAMFFFAFYAKLLQPVEVTAQMMPWVAEQEGLAAFTGIIDLLGALGLILPALLRKQPRLTVIAAYGGLLLMVSGIIFHVMRGESSVIGFNFLLIALLIFVAWGRSKKVIIQAR